MTANKTLVEYIHSSEIIEFFLFALSMFFLIMTSIRIFKYHDDFTSPPIINENATQKKKIPEKEKTNDKKNTENNENIKLEVINEQKIVLNTEVKEEMNGSNIILG